MTIVIITTLLCSFNEPLRAKTSVGGGYLDPAASQLCLSRGWPSLIFRRPLLFSHLCFWSRPFLLCFPCKISMVWAARPWCLVVTSPSIFLHSLIMTSMKDLAFAWDLCLLYTSHLAPVSPVAISLFRLLEYILLPSLHLRCFAPKASTTPQPRS